MTAYTVCLTSSAICSCAGLSVCVTLKAKLVYPSKWVNLGWVVDARLLVTNTIWNCILNSPLLPSWSYFLSFFQRSCCWSYGCPLLYFFCVCITTLWLRNIHAMTVDEETYSVIFGEYKSLCFVLKRYFRRKILGINQIIASQSKCFLWWIITELPSPPRTTEGSQALVTRLLHARLLHHPRSPSREIIAPSREIIAPSRELFCRQNIVIFKRQDGGGKRRSRTEF